MRLHNTHRCPFVTKVNFLMVTLLHLYIISNTCPSALGFCLTKIAGINSVVVWGKLITPHWGRVKHICVGNLTIIGSDNGLSPGQRQAIIWTNAGILLIGPLGTKFSEISIGIQTFSFKKMYFKMSSILSRPQCVNLLMATLLHLCIISNICPSALGFCLTKIAGINSVVVWGKLVTPVFTKGSKYVSMPWLQRRLTKSWLGFYTLMSYKSYKLKVIWSCYVQHSHGTRKIRYCFKMAVAR